MLFAVVQAQEARRQAPIGEEGSHRQLEIRTSTWRDQGFDRPPQEGARRLAKPQLEGARGEADPGHGVDFNQQVRSRQREGDKTIPIGGGLASGRNF